MPELSKVVVAAPAVVDIKRPDPAAPADTKAAAGEPSMAEYAAAREAELRGDKPAKPVVTDDTKPAAAATDDSAAATDMTSDDKGTTDEDPLTQIEETHVAKKGIAKRMGELTAEREAEKAKAVAALAEAEKAKQEAKEAQEELAKIKQDAEARAAAIPVVPKIEEDLVPDRDNFDDPDEFAGALAAHAARAEIRKANEAAIAAEKTRQEAVAAAAETARKAQAQEQIASLHKNFNERVVTAKTEYPDFDAKVTNNEKLVVRNDIFFTIEKAELAPHILYHLAGNQEEVASLNAMQPYDAAIRIGELQAEIRIARKPKASKAAEPVKPVGSRQSPARKSADEMSMNEYAAMRAEEDAQTRASKRPRTRQS